MCILYNAQHDTCCSGRVGVCTGLVAGRVDQLWWEGEQGVYVCCGAVRESNPFICRRPFGPLNAKNLSFTTSCTSPFCHTHTHAHGHTHRQRAGHTHTVQSKEDISQEVRRVGSNKFSRTRITCLYMTYCQALGRKCGQRNFLRRAILQYTQTN